MIQFPLENVIFLWLELFKNVTNIISMFEASLSLKTRNNFDGYYHKKY